MLRRFTSERVRKAHHKRLAVTVGIWSGLAVSIILLFLALFASKQIAIQTVVCEGNKAISNSELFNVVAPHLEGSYGHLFSRRNIFTFPKEAIKQDIFASFVQAEDVVIERRGLSTIDVHVVERSPVALWCVPGAASSTASCYFVDKTGYSFARAPVMRGGSFIVYERSLPLPSTDEGMIGSYLQSPEEFTELNDFVGFVASLGFKTRRVVWGEDAIDLVTTFGSNAGQEEVHLRVPLEGPYEQAFTNLASITQSQKNKKVGADEEPFIFANLEYVDLRFENKVFYKEKETEVSSDVAQ